MLVVHLDVARAPETVFRTEPPEALEEAAAACLWYPDEVRTVPGGCVPSDANLLMFLSDVRGRRFKAGVFLGEDVLAAVETFRAAARAVADGHILPDLDTGAPPPRAFWRALDPGDAFFAWCVDRLARRAGRGALETGGRCDTVHDAWLAALRSDDGLLCWPEAAEVALFARDLAAWRAPLACSAAERAALRFTLVPPAEEDGDWRIACPAPATRLGFVSLGQAARVFPPLRHPRITRADAEAFLRAGAADLLAAGFAVELPPGLSGERLSAVADLTPLDEAAPADAATRPVATARLSIRVDGETVSASEIRFLLDQGSSLVFFRNRWIEVDRFVLKEALRALEATKGHRLDLRAAAGFLLGTRRAGRLRIEQVRAHGWLRGLLNELRGDARFAELPPPAGLKAELRDYQVRGFSWLAFLTRWGFGPCLADDMGLGKTVQTLAWILSRPPDARRTLVVAPVSVTANWMRECARFAPDLKVVLHQGPDRPHGAAFLRAVRAADVVVTGYPLVVKDFRDFADAGFAALVLDEAQTVKNPDTHAARAVRALGIPTRVALTGTPLENSAADLWSLEEFLNPGLLGERAAFADEYARPIREDAHSPAAAKLKRTLEPFLLRRLKTMPGIAAELGEKREIREYCPLAPRQRRRYEDALEAYRTDCAAAPQGAGRTGRMLALITELKLVCDGVDAPEADLAAASGKVARLDDLLSTIFANGESALVFTQYAKVGAVLQRHLAETFGRRIPFLHGALSPERREAEIAAFEAAPAPCAFVLSLKAGGFGLNLVKATHVIHFDRWWNPAVEAQATDRAHRIGQTRTVFVHAFVCPGTLEERIDNLLESKRALAGELVGSGEGFLLKMGDAEFARMMELDA